MTLGSVGVIGAGIYGVTAALELKALGADVTLYEKRSGILTEATAKNFFRLHCGYHYPRSWTTAMQARDGYVSFTQMFGEALTPPAEHYYAIAAEGSLTSAQQFSHHCNSLGLRATPVTHPSLLPESVEACYEVDESYYDPDILRRLAWKHLIQSGVVMRLQHPAAADMMRHHDIVVVTAHAAMNDVLAKLSCPTIELQYELCEVAILGVPRLRDLSLVVLDGPFCSIAPYGYGWHILYDVVHSVHSRAYGQALPAWRPHGTQFKPMLASASRFTGVLDDARHIGSLFTTRVVLPGVDSTDTRHSKLWWAAPNVLSVLSGKVSASVSTARVAAAEVAERLAAKPVKTDA